MADKYSSFDELQAGEPEAAYRIICAPLAAGIAIVAPHAGKIELGSSEVAKAIAGSEYSLYCFEGRKPQGNRDLHITSTRFDEPQALELVRSAELVVTIHGCGDDDDVTYIGGLDDHWGRRIATALDAGGFQTGRHSRFQGIDPENICNRGRSGRGVQLELGWKLRGDLTTRGNAARLAAYASVIRGVLAS